MEKLQREANEEGRMPPVFNVQAQFLELYNEQIRDLFDSARRGDGKGLHIHEDAYGSIYLKGATMKSMSSEEEVCLCIHIMCKHIIQYPQEILKFCLVSVYILKVQCT